MDSQAYFVIDAASGNKYGPADVATLNQWIDEGRILPSTMLEDSSSGAQIRADRLPGLRFSVRDNPPQAVAGEIPSMSPPAGVASMSAVPAFRTDEGWRGYPVGVHFDFLNDSWGLMKKSWKAWIPVMLIILAAFAIGEGPSFYNDLKNAGASEADQFDALFSGSYWAFEFFSIVWSIVVSYPLYFGAILFALDIVDGKAPDLSRVFAPFKRWFGVVGSLLLLTLLLGIGFVLCLVPGIYLAGRLFYWPLLVADRKMGVMDSFSYVWDRQGPYAWAMFGMYFVSSLLAAVGILGLGIGIFFTVPMALLTLACQYRAMYPEFAPAADAGAIQFSTSPR